MFTIYQSTDAGAPVLSATAGALITVMDAVLVNGYGTKAAAGWTKAFTGTNKAAYRMGGGSRNYLRVLDTGPLTVNEARCTGYTSMSDVDTGGGAFGTFVSSSYYIIKKSDAGNNAAQAWIIVADERTFLLFRITAVSGAAYAPFFFGDFYSVAGSSDVWNTLVIGSADEQTSDSSQAGGYFFGKCSTAVNVVVPRHGVAATYTGVGGTIGIGKVGDARKAGGDYFTNAAAGAVPAPNPIDNAYYLSPLWLSESNGAIRGRMRGIWQLCGPYSAFSNGAVITGTNELQGKTFLVIQIYQLFSAGAPNGLVLIETSNTLENSN